MQFYVMQYDVIKDACSSISRMGHVCGVFKSSAGHNMDTIGAKQIEDTDTLHFSTSSLSQKFRP